MPLLDHAGNFKCRVLHADSWFGESGAKKTPYIGLPLEVDEGPDEGKHITHYMYLSDAAFDYSIEALAEAFGFDGDLNALANGEVSFEGERCSITTEMEEFEGKMSCKVKWLNHVDRVGGNGITPMDTNALSSLLSRYSGRAKAVAKNKLGASGATVKPATAPVAAAASAATDDLPF